MSWPFSRPVPAENFKFDRQRKTKTPEFDRWFGDSVVRSRPKKPRVVYHGTKAKVAFNEFQIPSHELGVHVGTVAQANEFVDPFIEKSGREKNRIYPLYASIQSPFRLPDSDTWEAHILYGWNKRSKAHPERKMKEVVPPDRMRVYLREYDTIANLRALNRTSRNRCIDSTPYCQELEKEKLVLEEKAENLQKNEIQFIRRALENAGYDGVVYRNSKEGRQLKPDESGVLKWRLIPADSYIVWNPGQLKAALGNRGTWDKNSPNILHGIRQARRARR